MNTQLRRALVFGATGFLGRHLILALAEQGVAVVAACRSEASWRRLTDWSSSRSSTLALEHAVVDFGAPGLGLDDLLDSVTEVYNCAGAYRFGMSEQEARSANVDTVRAVVRFAARMPNLRRLVHVSGYRVSAQEPNREPWDERRMRHTYRTLGAYEASKVEADTVFRHEADRLGVPWSIANPCTVSGVGATGEADQYLGLAGSFKDLWNGKLAALPGNAETFVPVVPVDFLARFMARLPTDPTTTGRAYWILDDATPPLPDLLRIVGEHYQVKVPGVRIPVGVVKRLPASLSKADPETLGFMSSDRYPVGDAQRFAARHGLALPSTVPAIRRWADHLAAHRFGVAVPGGLRRGFADIAGVHTFSIGPRQASAVVLPGLPVNADTWAGVAGAAGDLLVMDLPGLGMSGGRPADWDRWLDHIVSRAGTSHLIGHSIGAAAAVEAAGRHPDRIERLTLVSPFFLQPMAGWSARANLLTHAYLRYVTPASLSARLTGDTRCADALSSSVADLRRNGAAGRVARLLCRTVDRRWRSALIRRLAAFPGVVHIIVGSKDRLDPAAAETLATMGRRVQITTIDGGGHHPQLTHGDHVAAAMVTGGGAVSA